MQNQNKDQYQFSNKDQVAPASDFNDKSQLNQGNVNPTTDKVNWDQKAGHPVIGGQTVPGGGHLVGQDQSDLGKNVPKTNLLESKGNLPAGQVGENLGAHGGYGAQGIAGAESLGKTGVDNTFKASDTGSKGPTGETGQAIPGQHMTGQGQGYVAGDLRDNRNLRSEKTPNLTKNLNAGSEEKKTSEFEKSTNVQKELPTKASREGGIKSGEMDIAKAVVQQGEDMVKTTAQQGMSDKTTASKDAIGDSKKTGEDMQRKADSTTEPK